MPKRSSRPKDVNQNAFSIVQQVTGGQPEPKKEKNPAAVALGRLGGLKGGKARIASTTPERRKEIALQGAKARWKKPSA